MLSGIQTCEMVNKSRSSSLIRELCTTWDVLYPAFHGLYASACSIFITREDAMRRKIIELKGITKAYDGEKVLDHIIGRRDRLRSRHHLIRSRQDHRIRIR